MTYEEALKIISDRAEHYDMQDETQWLAEALRVGAEALKKQIPEKPTEYDNYGNITATDRCCLCNKVIYREYTHCPYCGQAIDWNVGSNT